MASKSGGQHISKQVAGLPSAFTQNFAQVALSRKSKVEDGAGRGLEFLHGHAGDAGAGCDGAGDAGVGRDV